MDAAAIQRSPVDLLVIGSILTIFDVFGEVCCMADQILSLTSCEGRAVLVRACCSRASSKLFRASASSGY